MAAEGTGMDIDWEKNGQCSQAVFSAVVITAQAQDMFLIARCNLIRAISFDSGGSRLLMLALESCVMAIKNIAKRKTPKTMRS
jgi:hypothetical protein